MGLSRPTILFVDDLQWGDADSASVLLRILSPPQAPPVLLIGSYRSDEAGKSPFLTTWNSTRQGMTEQLFRPDITVGPLTEEQCVELAMIRIGSDDTAPPCS